MGTTTTTTEYASFLPSPRNSKNAHFEPNGMLRKLILVAVLVPQSKGRYLFIRKESKWNGT